MENDFRAHFDRLTTRKPESWDHVPLHRNLGDWRIELLRQLPVVVTDAQPMMRFLGEDPPRECVVRVGERCFYVNTEGYSYARYAFEFPPSLLVPPGAEK